MSIIRTVRKESFTPICNELLTDTVISFRSKGLLCYLISRPPNWNANIEHLAKTFKEGKDALYSILNELIDAGYVIRIRLKNEKGRHMGVEYHVYETKKPQGEIPDMESSDGEKPDNNKERGLVNKEDNKAPALPATQKPFEKTIRQRQIEFLKIVIDWVADHPGKYPKLMYVEFAKYWVEPTMQKKKTKLRYEEQRFFDIARRLSTWFQKVKDETASDYWKKENDISTLNNLFKTQILNINGTTE